MKEEKQEIIEKQETIEEIVDTMELAEEDAKGEENE
jgi:hypothetical protein